MGTVIRTIGGFTVGDIVSLVTGGADMILGGFTPSEPQAPPAGVPIADQVEETVSARCYFINEDNNHPTYVTLPLVVLKVVKPVKKDDSKPEDAPIDNSPALTAEEVRALRSGDVSGLPADHPWRKHGTVGSSLGAIDPEPNPGPDVSGDPNPLPNPALAAKADDQAAKNRRGKFASPAGAATSPGPNPGFTPLPDPEKDPSDQAGKPPVDGSII